MDRWVWRRVAAALAALAVLGIGGGATAAPRSVTIAGSLQSEAGCSGDWQPDCAATHMTAGADGIYRFGVSLPAGSYEYKGTIDDSWAENYGLHATRDGANIPLNLAAQTSVKFYYDPASHWLTDNQGSAIVSAPGSFQSELGCSGDWQPDCLKSWLQDPDGDGVYTLETTGIPAGSYEGKAALNESWDENYGKNGVRNGDNIAFVVPFDGAKVSFRYESSTHVLTILAGHGADGNVEWAGLRHDSRDTLYRTPGGAVPAGTPVTLRFRTFHDDATSVKLRFYDVNANAQRLVAMQKAASGVSCYEASLATDSCDFWQATIQNPSPNNLWYRFVVADGSATAYYADDTRALDGGLGAASSDPADNSWALTVYQPGFKAPAWAANAVIYQIFPDRFRNADRKNDPATGTTFYDMSSVLKPWNAKPEGYCRSYTTPCSEGPRGRDFFGGDLKGIREKLEWIRGNGFDTIYLNPIFWARSNHRYDTANYLQVDPYLGDLKEFEKVVKQAHELGMHIILDGVFNHMSSDSPFFDRYHHWSETGACESLSSTWRSWFAFTTQRVPCGAGDYTGWFGFDTIPQLNKGNAAVRDYFVTGQGSVTRTWLQRGSNGWRMDVMGDGSFPYDYWTAFRQVAKETDPNALIVGELWQKDTTLLKLLRGETADTTMNYRLRDAVLGLLAPGTWDSKGFADSGHAIAPSKFGERLVSQQEDYAPAAYGSLMNLIDSHDTAHALWTFTPGADNVADKEQNAANVAEGKQRLRLASLIQYTLPGAPTVYYGDEVGVTGADDPDNRRTMPWPDTGGRFDDSLRLHYVALGSLRRGAPVLVDGDLRVLATDDVAGTVAYGRKDGSQAALVAVNRGSTPQTLTIPTAGWVPDGTTFAKVWGGLGTATTANGSVQVTVPALAGVVLVTGRIDLTGPAAPANLAATAGAGQVALTWSAVDGAAGYNLYRSPVTGGGYVKVNSAPLTATSLTDTGLRNGMAEYYVVRALDAAGNEGEASGEASAVPHLAIGYAVVQWPKSISQTITASYTTVYGQVYVAGETDTGEHAGIRAQLGSGPAASNPDGNTAWSWTEAAYNTRSGNNAEFQAPLRFEQTGSYDYAYRFSTDGGRSWVYGDADGVYPGNGYDNPAHATITASSDTTAPSVPQHVHVVSASPGAIEIAWDASSDPDDAVAEYQVTRDGIRVGNVTGTSFADTDVGEGATYTYVVRAADTALNRSAASAPITATASLRSVTLVIRVTVPATTDATGRSVHIAGFLDRLDDGQPQWDPAATSLTRVDATHWTITMHGKEATQIEYKYTLGSWDFVEKDGGCGEIANRALTLTYGSSGTQVVNDTVDNWRNVAPCGN